jgi:hypothetical protein
VAEKLASEGGGPADLILKIALDKTDRVRDPEQFRKTSKRLVNRIGEDARELSDSARFWLRTRSDPISDEVRNLPFHNTAIMLASKAVSLQPDSLEFVETLAMAEREAEDWDNAIFHFRNCVGGGRTESQPHLALALARRGGDGDMEEAYGVLIEYLRSHPTNRTVEKAVETLGKSSGALEGLDEKLKRLLSQWEPEVIDISREERVP